MKKGGGVVSKKGQVWVETILYTLIIFIIITLVLSFATPQIERIRDRSVIDNSIEILEKIKTTIYSIGSEGNKRNLELSVKKGEFKIDSTNNKILFLMDTQLEYSEVGEEIDLGGVKAKTEKKGSFYSITITGEYPNYNLTYEGKKENKTLHSSGSKYNLLITNKGNGNINFEVN